MFNLKKLLTPDENILWKSYLHWILVIKGAIWFGLIVCLALYLPCVFGNEHIPNFKFGFDFFINGLINFERITVWAQALTIIMVMGILLGLIIWFFYILKYISSIVIITENRLIYKTGLLIIHIEQIEIDEIEEVHLNTGLLGRIFNYAYVHFDMRFVGEKMIPMVAKPYKLVTYLHRSHDRSENKMAGILDKRSL
jgi:hypothetical protein